MAISDPIGDMLTRIRNGQAAGERSVACPASKLRKSVLEVLQREGYIRGYSWAEMDQGLPEFTIELKYDEGTPVIVMLRQEDGGLELVAGDAGRGGLVDSEYVAAEWALEHDDPAGYGTGTLPNGGWLFLPVPPRLPFCTLWSCLPSSADPLQKRPV